MNDVQVTKYDYIDAIRGFAILAVIMVHTSLWIHPSSKLLNAIAVQGAQGVQLFFIASALTLFLSLNSRKNTESHPTANFFIRRFFRIAPLFYLAIIMYTLYDRGSFYYWAPNGLKWWYVLLTALFLHGWHLETINSVVPGGWSIAVEMTFYLIVPFLFAKLKTIRSTLFLLFGALITSKLLTVLITRVLSPHYKVSQQYLISGFTYSWFFSQLPIFILGILLYQVIIRFPEKNNQIAFPLLLISFLLFYSFLGASTFADMLPNHFLYGLAFFVFSLSLHFQPQIFLVNKITTFIGKLSFSMYIVHFMVLKLAGPFLTSKLAPQGNVEFLAMYLIVALLTISVSFFTHKFIETPGINLGKRIVATISKQHPGNVQE